MAPKIVVVSLVALTLKKAKAAGMTWAALRGVSQKCVGLSGMGVALFFHEDSTGLDLSVSVTTLAD